MPHATRTTIYHTPRRSYSHATHDTWTATEKQDVYVDKSAGRTVAREVQGEATVFTL
jgi:hypothetical protein